MKVIIDTDIGDDVDDILALAFALRRPELDVIGITTVLGGVDGRCRMVEKLLSIIGRDDVTVAAGRSTPLIPDKADQRRWDGTPWQGAFGDDQPSRRWPDAPRYIVDAAARYGDDLAIVTIGPLTNIGAALQLDPELGKKVRFVASMAASATPGRKEYNASSDPEAMDLLLRSGAKLFIGTIETTEKVFLHRKAEKKLAERGTALTDALTTNIDLWRPHQGSKPGPVLYDVAPIVWAFRRDLYLTDPCHMAMILNGDRRGETPIADDHPNVELCVDVDVDGVLDLFFKTIL